MPNKSFIGQRLKPVLNHDPHTRIAEVSRSKYYPEQSTKQLSKRASQVKQTDSGGGGNSSILEQSNRNEAAGNE